MPKGTQKRSTTLRDTTPRRLRAGLIAAVGLSLVLSVASCSSSSSAKSKAKSSPSASAAVATGRTAQAKAAATADAVKAGGKITAPTGKKIGYMHLSESTEASVRLLDGVKQAAALFGFDVITCDPNFDAAKTAQCMTTLVAQSPDLIILEADATAALGGGLQTAASKGIPVIMAGALQAPSKYFTAQYVPDEKKLTTVLDTFLFGKIKDRVGSKAATIAAFQAPQVGPGVIERDTQRGKDLKAYPNLSQQTHDIDLSNAIQDTISQTKTFVAEKPNLQAIWQTCDFCAAANSQALDQLGLSGDKRPFIGAIYTTKQTRAQIKDGKITGAVELNFGAMGWVALDQALEHWARKKPFATDNSVFTSGYGIQMLQPWIVTQDNVGDPAVVRNQREDYVTYFETKWNAEFGVGPKR